MSSGKGSLELWARKDYEYMIKIAMQTSEICLLKSRKYAKNNHLSLIHKTCANSVSEARNTTKPTLYPN